VFAAPDVFLRRIFLTNNLAMRLLLYSLLGTLTCAASAQAPSALPDKISPSVWRSLSAGEPTDVLVIFSQKADLSAAAYLRGKVQKGQHVYLSLIHI
jgi:hypothetical protein